MKYTLLFISVFFSLLVIGQDQAVKKPEYVIVINDEIVTKEKVDQYVQEGYVKEMRMGITEEEWKRLSKKHGDKIGEDKMFVVMIS